MNINILKKRNKVKNVSLNGSALAPVPVKFKVLNHKKDIYKLIIIGWVATSLLFVLLIIFQQIGFHSSLSEKENNLFVVKDNKVYSASLADDDFFKSVDLKRYFLKTWTSNAFSYDKHSYESNINNALEWMDGKSAKTFYAGMEKSNTYNQLSNTNANTLVEVDSINIQLNTGEVYFKWITYVDSKLNSKTSYKLVTDLTESERTEVNPFGYLLTNTRYFKN